MARLMSLTLCSVLLGSIPASAHHSLSAYYNQGQYRTVEGVVKEFRFTNPHARLILLVAAQDGSMKEWDFEGGGVWRLTRTGMTANTIDQGNKITVTYNAMRNGSTGGFFVGLTTADGKYYGTREGYHGTRR